MNGLDLTWNNLCSLDPHLISPRTRVEFENDRYRLEFLKTSYLIIPDIREIRIESSPEAKVSFGNRGK